MKALIIGATGATGKFLVEQLLNDNQYQDIIVYVRKKTFPNHPKLTEYIINFNQIFDYTNIIQGNVAFSCLGTTLKDAGNKENQWKIDYDYQYQFAEICKQNNVKQFVLVSSSGANSNSKIFYSQMKGQLEDDIKKLNFETLNIIHPGLLIRPNSDRPLEKNMVPVINFLNKLGIMEQYKPLHVSKIAEVLRKIVNLKLKGNHTFGMNEILKLLS